ncbi:MAG: hypothetical protein AAF558_06095 [Verrucomicrobiota bacterium]
MTFRIFALGIALCFGSSFASANEQIFVSGGPSLRSFERHKPAPHDRFWGNFLTSSIARYKEVKPEIGSDLVTWLVYRPAYITRGQESNTDLIAEIKNMLKPITSNIVWFESRKEFLDYLHKGQDRSKIKIRRLEYFGHSNKRNWCFDYSNRIDGAVLEPLCLHVDHLKSIKNRIFTSDAYCRSWGCHSGEEYSRAWYKATGTRMWGAIGKTDYSTGAIPKLSTSGGKWVQ